MMIEVESLFLDPLRHRRGQLVSMENRLEDVIERPGQVARSVADHLVQLAEINTKLDRLDARVARIEKRRDLVDG